MIAQPRHIAALGGDRRHIFVLSVANLSDQPITVDRNAVRLRTPAGVRERQAGGAATSYVIPARGSHDVNVRFDMGGLTSGMRVEVTFAGAITQGGADIDLDPIRCTVD